MSYADATQDCGQVSNVLIVDDSLDDLVRQENKIVVERFGSGTCSGVIYIGIPERRLLSSLLDITRGYGEFNFSLGTDPDASVNRFAGSTRNATLLASIGSKAVSIDDDTLFNFFSFKEEAAELENAPPTTLPFGTAAKMHSYLKAAEQDPLALFDSVLGSSTEASATDDNVLSGPVRAAMAGICGGRWFSRAHAHISVPASVHSTLWKNRSDYMRAKSQPYALLLSSKLQLSGSPFFVTTCFGFDARVLLPPFFPGIRGSDLVWGRLLRACFRDSPIAYLPLAIEHDHTTKAPFSEQDSTVLNPIAAEIILQFIDYFMRDTVLTGAADMILALGERFVMLSRQPVPAFRELCLYLFLQNHSARHRGLEIELENAAKPPKYWKRDVLDYLKRTRSFVLTDRAWLPLEFLQLYGPDRGEEEFRHYLGQCGRLLCSWPEIWQAADVLHQSGRWP